MKWSFGNKKRTAAFQKFIHLESTSGLILLASAMIAMIIANTDLHHGFQHLLHSKISLGYEDSVFTESIHFWINDGLMTVFFFLVGLEIKREILVGELSTAGKAILPIAGAVGGMLVPFLVFALTNFNAETAHGWAIPMATDIAFAIGVLSLVGNRVPVSLKIFLTALAIADDIGAAAMISIFYSDAISLAWLIGSVAIVIIWLILSRVGMKNIPAYLVLGAAFWVAFLHTGIHPTISGIVYALVVPVKNRIDAAQFVERTQRALKRFAKAGPFEHKIFATKKQREALTDIAESTNRVRSPLQLLEHAIHPWVAFMIIPVFALTNAGVRFEGIDLGQLNSPLFWGIFFGLFLGKQIGVLSLSWLLVKLGLSKLNSDLTWRHIYGASCLAGIGFTMAIFVTDLSFVKAEYIAIAKVAIIAASILSGIWGFVVLRTMKGNPTINQKPSHG